MLYEVYTDANVALTAATAKTVLALVYPNVGTSVPFSAEVVDWDCDVVGAAQSTSCLTELVEGTGATAGTIGTVTATAFRQLRGNRAISLTAAQGSGGYGCAINRNYTAEPTVLRPIVGPRMFLNGGNGGKQYPLRRAPLIPPIDATHVLIGVRITSPIAVNCRASFTLEIAGA
jgi:hypothetical protein